MVFVSILLTIIIFSFFMYFDFDAAVMVVSYLWPISLALFLLVIKFSPEEKDRIKGSENDNNLTNYIAIHLGIVVGLAIIGMLMKVMSK